MTAWACGDKGAGAGAAPPPAAPAAALDTPKALRMASACGFGGGGCVALAGLCAANAAASAAACGFCGVAVAAFCRVAKMAAACGFGAGGCGGVGPRSAGTLCQEAAPAGRGNPGADAVGAACGVSEASPLRGCFAVAACSASSAGLFCGAGTCGSRRRPSINTITSQCQRPV